MYIDKLSKRTIVFFSLVLLVFQSFGQTRIKTMFYNLLNYESSTVAQNKTHFLKTILDEVNPDLFMVCELENNIASNYLFNNAVLPHNADFDKAPFVASQSPATSLHQMVYFNKKKLILESSKVIPTNTRDINHYTFKINTTDVSTNPIRLEVFVTHLKASTGSSNRQKRLLSVEDFTNALNSIPNTSYVLFAGDFNFYTSNEEGYQKIIDSSNSIVMVDPINRPSVPFPNNTGVTDPFTFYSSSSTYFWRNSSYADIHTQSTRTSNTGFVDTSGSTGGLDDRFDFIMMSQNFTNSADLFYINNSYKSIGNNGNCYNSYISNTNCSGTYSQSLRNALIEFSDHLPIVMEIESPRNTLSVNSYSNIQFFGSNVVEDVLKLNIPKGNPTRVFHIYNSNGQIVKSFYRKNKFNNQIEVSIEHLSRGIYYLSAQNLNSPLKFVKI